MKILPLFLILAALVVQPVQAQGHTIALNQSNPRWSEYISFTVNTSFKQPYVRLLCLQGDRIVKGERKAYFVGSSGDFRLYDPILWPIGGGASCTATIEKQSGNSITTHGSTSFTVLP